MFKQKTKFPLTLDLQYFAEGGEGGEGGGAGSQGGEGGGAEGGTDNSGQGANPIFTPEQQAQIDSLLKSAQDQIRNEYGKKQKELQTTIDQLKNQGKSKEQLAKEAEEKLQQGQAELLKSKNEFYAVRQLAKEGLDAELLDFVVTNEGDDEDARNGATDAKIKAITDIINKQVKAQVDAKFKDAGYNPGNGSGANGASGFKSVMDTIRANQIKK